jgi:capsular polysaccharide biosynthesis protein
MSLKEQINTFNSAKLLVTQAGAALANIMFMPEKSHVIVIAANSKYLHYAYFEEWANLFDVSLEYLKSVSKSEEPYKKDMVFSVNHPVNQDVFCNINNLINLIQRKVFHD